MGFALLFFCAPFVGLLAAGCACAGGVAVPMPLRVRGPHFFSEGGRGWATLGWPALCPSPLFARCLGRVSARRQLTSCPCSICPCRSPTHVPRRMGCGLVLPRGTGGEAPAGSDATLNLGGGDSFWSPLLVNTVGRTPAQVRWRIAVAGAPVHRHCESEQGPSDYSHSRTSLPFRRQEQRLPS